ncbi:C-type lectin domain family 4 member E-like isoform X1 [Rhinichthys klamathensis goyatoka]|uniref:C-type lectin domain family 4 member E-like isoform X1 n=1 Tax=Rhinichthys klamathensis goyatoka TaxID=3034132 RepID=UPI0024B4C3E7|nr:C-type lectin domain family 4 member E-like isoform X1 [Rhinichthys klamathensis goyatoka]
MPENIYINTFQNHNSRSAEKDQQKECVNDKRDGVCVVVLLSVLLFLSLLANAALAYLYYTNDTNQLMGCEPVTNNSNLEVNKPSLPCTYKGLPEKWVQDKGRFYVFSNDTMDWDSSRERCQDLGGDLVIINSSEEQEFLAQQTVSSNALVLHWIGLTDRHTEGTWLWVDNTPLNSNLSWWIFPPDDHDTHDPLGEDCAVLNGYLRGEKWGDISCLKKERSICEIPCS